MAQNPLGAYTGNKQSLVVFALFFFSVKWRHLRATGQLLSSVASCCQWPARRTLHDQRTCI